LHKLRNELEIGELHTLNLLHSIPTVDKGSSRCFDDAKRSHASQSFIQDKAIKDIQDG